MRLLKRQMLNKAEPGDPFQSVGKIPSLTHHVVSRKELLQELSLFVLDGLDDELVVARHVENGATGAWIGQLDEGLVAERILAGQRRIRT